MYLFYRDYFTYCITFSSNYSLSDLQQIIDNKNIISASRLTLRTFKQTVIRLRNLLLKALNDSSLMTLFPIRVDITIMKQICIIIFADSTQRTFEHRASSTYIHTCPIQLIRCYSYNERERSCIQ